MQLLHRLRYVWNDGDNGGACASKEQQGTTLSAALMALRLHFFTSYRPETPTLFLTLFKLPRNGISPWIALT